MQHPTSRGAVGRAQAYSSWRETSAGPREAVQNATTNRRTSRVSAGAGVPLKPANDRSGVDRGSRDRKPKIMLVSVVLLELATLALLLFSYKREKNRGLVLLGGTATEEDVIHDPVNTTGGHASPRPSLHGRVTRRTSLHKAMTKTERSTSSVVVIATENDMTSTSSDWEPPAVVKAEDEIASTSSLRYSPTVPKTEGDITSTSSRSELPAVVKTAQMTSTSSDWEPPAVMMTEDQITSTLV
ncbi:hypothetical protein MRX96_042062 [Rhipicephalus microplus]